MMVAGVVVDQGKRRNVERKARTNLKSLCRRILYYWMKTGFNPLQEICYARPN